MNRICLCFYSSKGKFVGCNELHLLSSLSSFLHRLNICANNEYYDQDERERRYSFGSRLVPGPRSRKKPSPALRAASPRGRGISVPSPSGRGLG